MQSIACFVGMACLIFMWIILSLMIPFFGGALGDVLYRASIGKSLDDKPYTYLISTMPIIGPMISTIIISMN